ncbi:hypothetical protein ACQI4E_10390 [Streptomyces sp. CA-252508]
MSWRTANRPGSQAPYFWPLYTGQSIPMEDWRDRMWLDTWV